VLTEAATLLAATHASLHEYVALAGSLDTERLSARTASGWTVAATLAHLAFYDDWVGERWRRRLRDGAFQDLPDDMTDLVNAAGARAWDAVDPERARTAALEAARAVADAIESLPVEALNDAVATGRPAMIDRSRHWDPHLREIRAALP